MPTNNLRTTTKNKCTTKEATETFRFPCHMHSDWINYGTFLILIINFKCTKITTELRKINFMGNFRQIGEKIIDTQWVMWNEHGRPLLQHKSIRMCNVITWIPMTAIQYTVPLHTLFNPWHCVDPMTHSITP